MNNYANIFNRYLIWVDTPTLNNNASYILDLLKEPEINNYLKNKDINNLYDKVQERLPYNNFEAGIIPEVVTSMLTIILEKFYRINVLEKVDSIKDSMYFCRRDIKSFTIPSNIKCLGRRCFKNSLIENVTIPGNVENLRMESFYGCDRLEKVIVEEGVEEIPISCFEACDNLKEITLPKSVKKLGKYSFQDISYDNHIVITYGGSRKDFYTLILNSFDTSTTHWLCQNRCIDRIECIDGNIVC